MSGPVLRLLPLVRRSFGARLGGAGRLSSIVVAVSFFSVGNAFVMERGLFLFFFFWWARVRLVVVGHRRMPLQLKGCRDGRRHGVNVSSDPGRRIYLLGSLSHSRWLIVLQTLPWHLFTAGDNLAVYKRSPVKSPRLCPASASGCSLSGEFYCPSSRDRRTGVIFTD